jgi:hypothetical protein
MRCGLLGLLVVLGADPGFAWGQTLPGGTPASQWLTSGPGDAVPATPPGNAVPGQLLPFPVDTAQPLAALKSAPPHGPTQEASSYPFLVWASGEGLFWWIKNGPAPPILATTGPLSAPTPGLPGAAGTTVLYGGQDIGFGTFAGGRWAAGSWLDLHEHLGVEVSGFLLERRTRPALFVSDGSGNPVIARPFTEAQTGQNIVDFATFPNRFVGGVAISARSRLWGIDASLLHNAVAWQPLGDGWGDWRGDMYLGFRYLNLRETLSISQNSQLTGEGVADFNGLTVLPPNVVSVDDSFGTNNDFYGGELGGRVQYAHGHWQIDCTGKVSLGTCVELITINGSSTLSPPPGTNAFTPITVPGGLLATSTNIGHHGHEQFAVVPEALINLSYQLCPECRVYVGYSFLYWSQVVRASNQIDTTVNTTQVPTHPSFGPLTGPLEPLVPFRQNDFWAQGINVGLEVHY